MRREEKHILYKNMIESYEDKLILDETFDIFLLWIEN